MSESNDTKIYTKVSAEYVRKLAAGEIPQSTIPRTPTVEAAYEYHKKEILASGMTVGEYIKQSVLNGADRLLESSPFPYACDIGIDHLLYWMRDGYEPVDEARRRIADTLNINPATIYVIRNTSQSVPEVPHYQVFIVVDCDTFAPCYELPGQTRTHADYVAEWESLLGYPVELSYYSSELSWQPADNIIKNGGSVRTFRVKRA